MISGTAAGLRAVVLTALETLGSFPALLATAVAAGALRDNDGMHITMVKKRLLDGSECRKCQEATAHLQSRGLWERIDEIVWVDERDAASAGQQLAQQHGVDRAPFFIVRDERGGIPDVGVGRGDVQVAAEEDRRLGAPRLLEPASEPGEPAELPLVEGRVDLAAVRGVEADDADAADEEPRALMMTAPRCWIAGMNCSRYHRSSTSDFASAPTGTRQAPSIPPSSGSTRTSS